MKMDQGYTERVDIKVKLPQVTENLLKNRRGYARQNHTNRIILISLEHTVNFLKNWRLGKTFKKRGL